MRSLPRSLMDSELAAEAYCDEVVDGSGVWLHDNRGLTAPREFVTLDSDRSVSGVIRFEYPEESDGCDAPVGAPSFSPEEVPSDG